MDIPCAMKVKLHTFLILSTDGGNCSVSCSKKTTYSNHWVGPRPSLDMVMTKSLPACNQTHMQSLQTQAILPHKVLPINPTHVPHLHTSTWSWPSQHKGQPFSSKSVLHTILYDVSHVFLQLVSWHSSVTQYAFSLLQLYHLSWHLFLYF
jgi:hypothetical protein